MAHLDASLRDLPDDAGAEDLADLAFLAFQTGLASLLVGAEEVGRLSLAIEHALDRAASGELDLPRARDLLGPPREVLSRALHQLQNADRSGARVEGLPLTETTSALLAALPGAPAGAPPPRRPPSRTSVLPPPGASVSGASLSGTAGAQAGGGAERFVWSPSVDDDMVELFFDEAAERIEGISDKLIQLERTPEDAEVLRDLFRDMHTVKGSSAMVGLAPMNRLAHAAEDLVGQLRDGDKAADAPVTNALLGALDGLRTMLEQARSRHPLTVDPTPMLRALKDPASAPVRGAAPAQTAALVPSPATPGEPAVARQTIRVDFDKLDRLLNLVGELVLGRDGLRGAGTALSSVTGELSSDRGILRRTAPSKRHGARAPEGAERAALSAFREEIHRIERVLGSIAGDLDASTSNIDSISSELRDQVMRLRMIPVGGILRKHQRTVRDLGQSLGKRVRLVLHGEDTELDKLLVEALDEPVMHLVRNAVDHGMETPAERAAAGKPAEGTIVLSASHRGNQVMLRIRDDGRGMNPARLRQKGIEKGLITEAEAESMDDRAALELVFRAGFSTAATVSDVSGRGVGLDVVRQTIVARLKGTIDIDSEVGRGTTFSLRLPLTLAIIQVLLARVCGEILAIPLDNVDRTIVVSPADIGLIGDREVIVVDGKNVPLVRLGAVLELPGPESDEDLHVVLTEQGGELYGLSC
ncbi:MAG: chemotaxis protein CheA, partial [Polyangiaceae bacterium]